ncbi:unnamed protein product [Prorocentrum cordatum]|nr:unnamed protein product [Polarella glacialis]
MEKITLRFPLGMHRGGGELDFLGEQLEQRPDKSVKVSPKSMVEDIELTNIPAVWEWRTSWRAIGWCASARISLWRAPVDPTHRPGDLHDIRHRGDAAWANAKDQGSQAGWIIMAGDIRISRGSWGNTSPLPWRSHRLARKVPSSLAAETLGADEGLANGIYLRAMFARLAFPGLMAWTAPETGGAFPLIAVADSKCLYDHLDIMSAGPCKDWRTALDIAILRGNLKDREARIRWSTLSRRNGCADLLRGVSQKKGSSWTSRKVERSVFEEERQSRVTRRGAFGRLTRPSETTSSPGSEHACPVILRLDHCPLSHLHV